MFTFIARGVNGTKGEEKNLPQLFMGLVHCFLQ